MIEGMLKAPPSVTVNDILWTLLVMIGGDLMKAPPSWTTNDILWSLFHGGGPPSSGGGGGSGVRPELFIDDFDSSDGILLDDPRGDTLDVILDLTAGRAYVKYDNSPDRWFGLSIFTVNA
jgi:hypothetical protein